MNLFRSLLLYCFLLIVPACNNNQAGQREQNKEEDKMEEYISEHISHFPEVKHYQSAFEQDSLPITLSVVIRQRPGKDENFYWVECGYFDEKHFIRCYNFFFYPADSSVKFYDLRNDFLQSLEEWRATKGKVTPYMLKEQHTNY